MRFSAGAKLGTYEIIGPLGAGGMGEVYRARDLKLKREVAIKVLPDAFAVQPERVARFQREAEILAALNHPHIAAIHDVDQFGDSRFLVLELVEGETLADRLARGPIPLDEALKIAKQIAEALEAAHEKGIIHRDLKPANIKVEPSGTVKVLDFGLAKVHEADPAGASLSNSPTMMSESAPGIIVGTAAYMSPEQTKGKETDRTSDIWAFGCVLYEMLTGGRAFRGETVSEIFAGILMTEPDWRLLPGQTPQGIRRLLRRCLQKEGKLRFRDSGDVRIEIEEAQSSSRTDDQPVVSEQPPTGLLKTIFALAVIALLIGAIAMFWRFRQASPALEMRLEITTPATTDPVSLAISPNGRMIAFVATSEGRPRLWLRSLESGTMRPLPGADFATSPFWSPDNRSLGFFADGKLKRIDVDGGSLQTLANAQNSRGGTWNPNGVIVFAPSGGEPLLRVPATGGELVQVTRLGEQQGSHRYPKFLPDGHHVLYYVQGSPEASGIYVCDLDGSEPRRLLAADSGAVYASSGLLLYIRQGTLFEQNFDPERLALSGNPTPIAEQIAVDNEDVAALSASAAGPIVYRTGSVSGRRQLTWFDRSGKEVGKVGEPIAGPLNPSMSPDGRNVALFRTVSGNVDIWLLDVGRGVLTRFTSDTANEVFPIWSADGSRVAYSSIRKGVFNVFSRQASGIGGEELILPGPPNKNPLDWSRDGFLLYRALDPKTGFDLWAMALNGERKPFPVVQTNSDERDGQFSPDGKWIAYQSNESGRSEIYVQSFREPSGKLLVSTNGGAQVRWRRDGNELFYVALDSKLMAVPIRIASSSKVVEAGVPQPLFTTRVGGALQSNYTQQYMVSADGQRFLMNTVVEEPTLPITILLNWTPRP